MSFAGWKKSLPDITMLIAILHQTRRIAALYRRFRSFDSGKKRANTRQRKRQCLTTARAMQEKPNRRSAVALTAPCRIRAVLVPIRCSP
jgi:hypothetical protein